MERAFRLLSGIPRGWWNISDGIGRSAGDIAKNITHNELVKATVHYIITMGIFIGVPTAGVLVLKSIYSNLTGDAQIPDISLGAAGRGGGEIVTTPLLTDRVIFQATPSSSSDLLSRVQNTVNALQNQGWNCAIIDRVHGIPNAFRAALQAGRPDVLEPGPYQHVINDGRALLEKTLPQLVWDGNAICVRP